MSDLVMAATRWPTNGHLIADVARLGYFQADQRTLDPTYGRGRWWSEWRPDELVTHDLRLDGVDFRQLPEPDGYFDQIAFDPPYMAPGGRSKSTIHDFNDRFGLHTTARTPAENQELINGGLKELSRVLAPRGRLIVKCMDYVNGGRLFLGTHHTLAYAIELGLRVEDRLEHITKPGPQSQKRQVHARRNLSTLFVLRAP